MPLDNDLKYLETIEWDCIAGLSSGLSFTRHILNHSPEIQAILEVVRGEASALPILREQVRRLVIDSGDPQYTHPHDHALTAYAYILGECDHEEAAPILFMLLRADRIWWARRIGEIYANKVLNNG